MSEPPQEPFVVTCELCGGQVDGAEAHVEDWPIAPEVRTGPVVLSEYTGRYACKRCIAEHAEVIRLHEAFEQARARMSGSRDA